MEVARRSFITGLISLMAAPAIVRVSSIMPVKALPLEPLSSGVYLIELDHVEIEKRLMRFTWKLLRHGENYGMGAMKMRQIIEKSGV